MRFYNRQGRALSSGSLKSLFNACLLTGALMLGAPSVSAQDVSIGADIGADIGVGIGGLGGSSGGAGVSADSSVGVGSTSGTANAGAGAGANIGGTSGLAATADVSFGGVALGIGPEVDANASIGAGTTNAGATAGLSVGIDAAGTAGPSVSPGTATASDVATAVGNLDPSERLRLRKTCAQVLANPTAARSLDLALCRLVVASN